MDFLKFIYCGCDFVTKLDKLGTELNKLVKKVFNRVCNKKH